MALVVEDGTGVAGANSYLSLVAIRTYATTHGLTVSGDDVELEASVLDAMAYIEAIEFGFPTFHGTRTDITQPLSWPRKDTNNDNNEIVLANGVIIATDGIPLALTASLAQLTFESEAAGGLLTNTNGRAIVEEKVGPITTKFASPDAGGSARDTQTFTKFESLIISILNLRNPPGNGFVTRRV